MKNGDVQIPSSAGRMKAPILAGWAFLTIVYVLVLATFDYLKEVLKLPPPAPEYCPPEQPDCDRPDLFAFQASSGCALVFSGVLGFVSWHIRKDHVKLLPATAQGRLLGFLPSAEWLMAASVTFQLWDFVVSLLIPEHCTALMLTHHLLAALVAWYGLNNQYLHYYAVFFLGLTEVSGMFLAFVDVFRYFPPAEGSLYHTLASAVAGPFFAITFIYYRVICWWPVSIQLWQDIRELLFGKGRLADQLRPGRNHVLYFMLVANFSLGLLQLYWSTIILEEAKKVLS